jgi:hypothetical protein
MWLQILFCILAILALVRPYQVQPGLVAGKVVLAFDTSASMSAGGRLDGLLNEAQQIVRQAPQGSEFLVATLDRQLTLRQPFSSDRVSTLRQLQGIAPQAVRGRDELLAPFFLSIQRNNPECQLHWFSDHPLAGLPHIDHLATQGKINYAIESFQASPEALFLALKNHHREAAQLRLQIRGSQGFTIERSFSLRGLGRQLVQIPLQGQGQGDTFHARLLNPDDMALDNQAWCQSIPGRRVRLIAHGNTSSFLEQAAQAASGAPLLRQNDGSPPIEGIHLWNQLPEKIPAGQHLALAPPKSWIEGKPVQDPSEAMKWVPELERKLQFRLSSLRWGPRISLKKSIADLEVLVTTLQGDPLIVQHRSALVFLFPLEQSDLPLSPELPVLISNWLRERQDPWDSLKGLLCDSRVQIPRAGPFTLQGPRGPETLQSQGASKMVEWSPSWPGLYRLDKHTLVVNFYAPEESNLERPPTPPAPPPPVTQSPGRTRPMTREITLWLVALALLVLCLEYYWWRR